MTTVAEHGSWIRRFHPAPASPVRLICFPHAGGSASFYLPLSASLAPSVEVLSVQYPGRQDRWRERCFDSIEALADQLAEALAPLTGQPFAFLGHSMGAVVAFEVTRRLEQQRNVTPVLLVASAARAPSRRRPDAVHLLNDDALTAELGGLSGTEADVLADPELLEMILPTVRSDYRAIETYRCPPGAAVRCPVTAFLGDADPYTTLVEMDAWKEHTTGSFRLRTFSGGHFFLTSAQDSVTEAVVGELARYR